MLQSSGVYNEKGGEIMAEAIKETKAKEVELSKRPKLITTSLADVKPVQLQWLWHNRIPAGKYTLIIGEAGLGKSLLTTYVAAIVTTGRPWIDVPEEKTTIGSVILLTAEDDLNDTVRPRMDAAGADPSKVFSVDNVEIVRDGKKKPRCFDLREGEHLEALYSRIEEVSDVRLCIIDPITAYFGNTDSHKNTEVRAVLHPLCKLAAETGVAVLGISHLNKDQSKKAIHRATGSTAFVDAARAVWGVAKHPTDKDNERRVLVPVKGNLSPNPTSLAFRLVSTPAEDGKLSSVVCAIEPDTFYMTADEALSADSTDKRSEKPAPKRDRAIDLLQEILKDGPLPAKDIKRIAKENSISEKALKTAKKSLGVRSDKEGIGKNQLWLWRLPTQQEASEDVPTKSQSPDKRVKAEVVPDWTSKSTGSS